MGKGFTLKMNETFVKEIRDFIRRSYLGSVAAIYKNPLIHNSLEIYLEPSLAWKLE